MAADKKVRMHIGQTGHESWIEVDGQRLDNVRSVDIRMAAGEVSGLQVQFIPTDIDLTMDPEVWERAVSESGEKHV